MELTLTDSDSSIQTRALASALDGLNLADTLSMVATRSPGQAVFTTALGQEDQVIADAIWRNGLGIRVATLDTGRLFAETYSLMDETRAHYGKTIGVFLPDGAQVERLCTQKGMFSFYESVENRKECCHIRKVLPLRRALAGASVWITGLRAAQSASRANLARVEWDAAHNMIKVNPLIDWSLEEVQAYLRAHSVPDNPLHRKGFVSIGCAPCTRAIEPGEDARDGRWWWETSKKECGLHV